MQYRVSDSARSPTDNIQTSKSVADCLIKNSYKEEKCQSQIDNLYKCCNRFYEREGDAAHTVSCPKASLLRLKMKRSSGGQSA